MIKRSIITWIMFTPIAILNGIIRETTYKSVIGDNPSHIISTIIGALAYLALSYFMLRDKISNQKNKTLYLIGLMWVVMTITFEFVFGYFVEGYSLEKLFADYNIFAGRVWALFLATIFLTPKLVKKFNNFMNEKKAARSEERYWFIALLFINTAGILPILYLLTHNTRNRVAHLHY